LTYYLGIDGGGSKTTCIVGDETSLLATVTTGASNITRVGESCAREALQQAIHQACGAGKIDPRQVKRTCVGVAGAGRATIADSIRKIVAEIIPGEIEVVGDMEIALAAAFGKDPGVIVIAGTGSIAYGRDTQGRTARAGGWGFAISDEGSAHWIGRTAVGYLLRAIDQGSYPGEGSELSPLFREFKSAWKVASFDEFVRKANSGADFALLFPAILAAANGEDGVAQRVLVHAGWELAQLAAIVVDKLFAKERADLPTVSLAMAGGVFRHSPAMRAIFCHEVLKLDSRLDVNREVVEPVLGALQMARRS
jgi:glucosamine kinase